MKKRPVGADLFYVDTQTDRHDNANSRFSKFYKSAQKSLFYNLTTEGSHLYMLLQTW